MFAFAESRTGAIFGTNVSVEKPPVDHAPPAIHVLSNARHGWASAHRAIAAEAFGTTIGKVRRVTKMQHVNINGVLVIHSWWYGPTSARSLGIS